MEKYLIDGSALAPQERIALFQRIYNQAAWISLDGGPSICSPTSSFLLRDGLTIEDVISLGVPANCPIHRL